MDITAAIVRSAGAPFTLEAVTLDDPQPDEVLVRVVAVAMCHTDLAVQHGHIPVPLPAVLGHEGAGVVEAVGDNVTTVRVGDHVVMSQAFCGTCARCAGSEPSYCENAARLSLGGRRADGTTSLRVDTLELSSNFVGQSSFATHAIVKARNACVVDRDVPLATLAPMGCGVMTGAGAIFNDAKPGPGSTVAVFGCGAVGLSAVMAAKVSGAHRIVAVDLHRARLDLALQLGATDVVDGAADVVAAIQAMTHGGVDVAIEAAGVPQVAATAVMSTNKRGRTVIVGAAPFGSTLELDWWAIGAGRSVQGSVVGSSNPARDIPRLIDLWRQGRLPIESMITKFPFADINEAAQQALSGVAIKPVLVFDALEADS